MCWSKLLSQCRCSRCGVLCCKKRKTLAKLTKFQTVESPLPFAPETAPQPVTELLQIRANRLMTTSSLQRESSVSTPTPSTTPELNAQQSEVAAITQPQPDTLNEMVDKPFYVLRNTTVIMTNTLNTARGRGSGAQTVLTVGLVIRRKFLYQYSLKLLNYGVMFTLPRFF